MKFDVLGCSVHIVSWEQCYSVGRRSCLKSVACHPGCFSSCWLTWISPLPKEQQLRREHLRLTFADSHNTPSGRPLHHRHTRTFLTEFHQMQPQITWDLCFINSKTPCCYFMFSWTQFFWSIAKAKPIGLFCSRWENISSQVSARVCLSIVSLIDNLHAAAAQVLATEGLVGLPCRMPVLAVAGQQQVHLERFLPQTRNKTWSAIHWLPS